MAGSVNKVILIGRLGRDPEMRFTPGGLPVCNMVIATSTYTGEGEGKEEVTEWHRVVAFGKLAEICGQYLSKGRLVYVEGRLQTRRWEDRNGNVRYTTEIIINNMQILDSKKEEPVPPPEPKEEFEDIKVEEVKEEEDEIPF